MRNVNLIIINKKVYEHMSAIQFVCKLSLEQQLFNTVCKSTPPTPGLGSYQILVAISFNLETNEFQPKANL